MLVLLRECFMFLYLRVVFSLEWMRSFLRVVIRLLLKRICGVMLWIVLCKVERVRLVLWLVVLRVVVFFFFVVVRLSLSVVRYCCGLLCSFCLMWWCLLEKVLISVVCVLFFNVRWVVFMERKVKNFVLKIRISKYR